MSGVGLGLDEGGVAGDWAESVMGQTVGEIGVCRKELNARHKIGSGVLLYENAFANVGISFHLLWAAFETQLGTDRFS